MNDEYKILYPSVPHICDLCVEAVCENRDPRYVSCTSFRPRGEQEVVRTNPYDAYPCKKCTLCNMEAYAKGLMFCTSESFCWKNNDWAEYRRRRS